MTVSDKRLIAAQKQAVYYRNYRRARGRALVQLAKAHPEEYKQLLQRERARDKETGKVWNDLSGAVNRGGLSRHPDPSGTFTSTHTENESHYGGKA